MRAFVGLPVPRFATEGLDGCETEGLAGCEAACGAEDPTEDPAGCGAEDPAGCATGRRAGCAGCAAEAPAGRETGCRADCAAPVSLSRAGVAWFAAWFCFRRVELCGMAMRRLGLPCAAACEPAWFTAFAAASFDAAAAASGRTSGRATALPLTEGRAGLPGAPCSLFCFGGFRFVTTCKIPYLRAVFLQKAMRRL